MQAAHPPYDPLTVHCPPCRLPQDLTWRVGGGSELPALAPRCIALLIGTNDVNSHISLADHIAHVDFLLGFLQVRS